MARPEIRSNIVGTTQVYTYPDSLGQETAANHHYMIIDAFTSNVIDGYAADTQPNLSVAMYIPPGALKTKYESKYNTFEGGEGIINIAKTQLSGVKTFDDIKSKMMTSFAGDGVSETLTEQFDSVAYIGAKKALESSDITRAAAIGGGIALNPYMTVHFSGPGQHRNFGFSFDFIARRKEESETIQKIISGLKERMLPGQLTQQGHSYFLTYPDQFNITFYINGEAQGKDTPIFRISRSVLTDLSVDYGGQGTNVFFKDTPHPFNIKLDLQFQELDILTREHAKEGY